MARFLSLFACAMCEEVPVLPGYGKPQERVLSGYMQPDVEEHTYNLWYIFYEARKPTPPRGGVCQTPLLVWLNGGPGASSSLGNFLECGPYKLHQDHTLTKNEHSWNSEAHMIFVDNPVGTGYSFSPSGRYVTDFQELGRAFRENLLGFAKQYPEYASCPIHLSGESFAGVYIPAIATEIHEWNRGHPAQRLPLEGLLVGNPGIWHWAQFGSQLEFFYTHGLASDAVLAEARGHWENCIGHMSAAQPDTVRGFEACSQIEKTLVAGAAGVFLYDVRQFGDVFDDVMSVAMERYLNTTEVMSALHARVPWLNGDGTAHPNPVVNHVRRLLLGTQPVAWLSALLEAGLRVTTYNGVMDGSCCNHLGHFAVTKTFDWTGRADYLAGARKPWGAASGAGGPYGFSQTGGGLRFVWVMNSGHMVPTDVPEVALELLRRHLADDF